MMNVAIIGAAGYVGGELLRLLMNHPHVTRIQAISRSQGRKKVASVHEDLFMLDLEFQESLEPCDLVFMAGDHGQSLSLYEEYGLKEKAKYVIDLAHDHRDESEGYVYGLSEIFAERIASTAKVANPGCFATAIQLGLLPLAYSGKLKGALHVTGITGSTGAGQKLQKTSHFSSRQQNMSPYKAFEHQHLPEIRRTLKKIMPEAESSFDIHFVPIRGPFTRGIMVSMTLEWEGQEEENEIIALYSSFYSGTRKTFVDVTQEEITLKSVVNTNQTRIQVNKHGSMLHIVVCIDNLLKGASGQAVQNMNLMLGLPLDAGLRLKPLAY